MAASLPERGSYLKDLKPADLTKLLHTLRLPDGESVYKPSASYEFQHEAALSRLPVTMQGPHNMFSRATAKLRDSVELCELHGDGAVNPQVIRALNEMLADETLLYSDIFRRWGGIPGREVPVLEEWLSVMDRVGENWYTDGDIRGPLRQNAATSARELESTIPGSSSNATAATGGSGSHLKRSATSDMQYRVGNGCEACICAMVGGRPEVLIALLASVHGRTDRNQPKGRLEWVLRMWISGRDDEEYVAFEAAKLGKFLEWTREVIELRAEGEVGGWLADVLGGGSSAMKSRAEEKTSTARQGHSEEKAPMVKRSHSAEKGHEDHQGRSSEERSGKATQRMDETFENHRVRIQGQLDRGVQDHTYDSHHELLHADGLSTAGDFERPNPHPQKSTKGQIDSSSNSSGLGQSSLHPIKTGLTRSDPLRVGFTNRDTSESLDSQDGTNTVEHPFSTPRFRYPAEYSSPPPSPTEQLRIVQYPAPSRIEEPLRNRFHEHGVTHGVSKEASSHVPRVMVANHDDGPKRKGVSPAVRAALDAPPRQDPTSQGQVQNGRKRSYRESFTGLVGPSQITTGGTQLHVLDPLNGFDHSASRGTSNSSSMTISEVSSHPLSWESAHPELSKPNGSLTPATTHGSMRTTSQDRGRTHQSIRQQNIQSSTPRVIPQAHSPDTNQARTVTRRSSHDTLASFTGILGAVTVNRDGTAQHVLHGAPADAGLLQKLAMAKTIWWDNERSRRWLG